MDKKKKIICGILLAIILIGIIIVIVKGFNVGLSLRPHHTFKYVFDKEYSLKDIEKICDEVFKNKDYRIRGVEVFNDAIYVEASTITEEEQKILSEKFDNLYKIDNEETEVTEEITESKEEIAEITEETKKYEFFNDSNIKLTDELKTYIMPICISALIILIYTMIRFKKLNNGIVYKTLLNLIIESLIIVITLLSIIAIFRIPLEKITFSILIIIELIYLVIKFAYMEKKLKEI